MNQPTTAATNQPPSGIESAMARNRAFAARRGHHGATVRPSLGLFVITCLDPRVDPAHVLGLDLGDAIVLRNVGGRVTPAVVADVVSTVQLAEKAAPPDRPLFNVAVIHHTQCLAATLDDGFGRGDAAADGSGRQERAFVNPETAVADDVEVLRAAVASPRVRISGHVYDIANGLLQTVVAPQLFDEPSA